LVEILYKECAIKVLFDRIIKNDDVTAPPNEHAENPQRGRNRLKVEFKNNNTITKENAI